MQRKGKIFPVSNQRQDQYDQACQELIDGRKRAALGTLIEWIT